MKRLLLMRHGEAYPSSYGVSDHDRALTDNGVFTNKLMVNKIVEKNISFDLMLTSSASRALSTCELAASLLNYDEKKIKVVPSIYNCTFNHLEQIILKIDSHYNSTAIFGHNPSFHTMSGYLFDNTIIRFPESSMICVDFHADTWQKCFISKKTIKFLNYSDNV